MMTTWLRNRGTVTHNGLVYEHAGTLPVYRFEQLNGDPALIHAIFTRLGGISTPPYESLNLGHSVGDDPIAVETNHARVYQALEIPRSQVVTCHLTHGDDTFVVEAADGGRVVGRGDAMVTADAGLFLGMRFADCVPILLHDPVRRAVGLAHAGWRGTVQNVAGSAVQTMINDLGCSPKSIRAMIGPSIGPCCYQVGEDVIRAGETIVTRKSASGSDMQLFSRRNGQHAHFDLWEANRRQLEAAGVDQVMIAGLCTACRTDHFFSHRAERGRTGRFGVVIGYRE
jgi:YfiH family protein